MEKPRETTFQEVNNHLSYDPETGEIRWKRPTQPRIALNDLAGHVHSNGYVRIALKGRLLSGHRIANLLMTGEWPKAQMDHINGNRSDNRWVNLREATVVQNLANRPVMPSSKTRIKGVYWSPRHKRFGARIRVDGQRKFLGYFDSMEQASEAYELAARTRHGEFFRPSRPLVPLPGRFQRDQT